MPVAAGDRQLLERGAELDAVDALVERAAEGEGGALLIEGAAGLGKTTLLAAATTAGRQGRFLCLRARGGELEQAFAYGAARELFGVALPAEALDGPAAPAAEALGLRIPQGPPGPDRAFAVRHGFYWLVQALAAQHPLLLAVDDVQWLDRESAGMLAFLARRLEGLRVAIVLGSRPFDALAFPELAQLTGDASLTTLELAPLGIASAAELAAAALGPSPAPAFVAACHHATGGNPFLLERLLSALADTGTQPNETAAQRIEQLGAQALGRTTLLRLGQLSHAAVDLARATAILGTDVALRHAARLADITEDDAARAADELAGAGIFAPGRPLEFLHPLVRTSVHDDLPPATLAIGHRRAARMLDDDDARPDVVAAHLLHTDGAGDPWVVDALAAGARQAAELGASELAASLLVRALAEPASREQRKGILTELGRNESEAGLTGQAAGRLREAVALESDPTERARLSRMVVETLFDAGEPAEARELARAALSGVPEDTDEWFELRSVLLFTSHPVPDANDPRVIDLSRRAAAAGGPGAASVLAQALEHRFRTGLGTARGTIEELHAVLDAGLAYEPAFWLTDQILLRCEDLPAYRAFAAAETDRARREGSRFRYTILLTSRVELAWRMGSLREAESDARALFEHGEVEGEGAFWINDVRVAMLAAVLALRGELEESRRLLDGAPTVSAAAGEDAMLQNHFTALARGWHALARNDARAAVAALENVEAALRHIHLLNPAINRWQVPLIEALALAGEHERARELAEEALAIAESFGAPGAHGDVLAADGIRRAAAGDPDAEAVLRRAIEVLEPTEYRFMLATARYHLGALLRRDRRVAEAREQLGAALDLAAAGGMELLAQRARSELVSAGARPRRARLSGLDSLTASERRVAQLASAGLSNPEVAQALFVTLGTVEKHLTSVYGKLDCRRDGLADALAAAT